MKKNIKKYIVKDFIKKYKRVPSESEIEEIFSRLKKKNPQIDEIGLIASNMDIGENKIFFSGGSESSWSSTAKSLEKSILDIEQIEKEYSELIEFQKENSIDNGRIFKNIQEKINNLIKKINLEILLSGKQDIFSYGIVEDFSSREKVDSNRSTVKILDNNKVALNYYKSSTKKINVSELSIECNHLRGSQLYVKTFGSKIDLLEEDEKFFKYESASEIEDDIVEFVVKFDFRVAQNIEQIKYKLQSIQGNSKLQEEVFYSENGVDFKQLELPGNIDSDINYIDLNNEEILYKKIIIKFRKTAYDYKKNGNFIYCLSMDYLGFVNNEYRDEKEGVLFLGPYSIVDEQENPVNFSSATIKKGTCCEIPNLTSINFFLSKDGVDYIKAGFSNESSDVISFDDNTNNNILEDFEIIDTSSESEFLISDKNLIDYEFEEKEIALNVVLKEEKELDLNLESLRIYRNVFVGEKSEIDGFYKGWVEKNNYFECNIILESGATIDVGGEKLFIDGVEKSGKIFITEGRHKIKIDQKYFYRLDEKNIKTERELSRKDRYYPYNPKLLIEGFSYSKNFRGNRRYSNLGYIYAAELEKTNNILFKENKKYDKVCYKKINGDTFFIIHDVNNSGKFEEFDIKYRKNKSESSNLLYIKAVLKTESKKISPKIDQIQVRVI